MDALKKLLLLVGTAVAALAVAVGPVAAAEEAEEAPAGEVPAEDEGGIVGEHGEAEANKIKLAETPRDQIGLILLGLLVVGGGLAASNARRQLKGERPAASGEFRWR